MAIPPRRGHGRLCGGSTSLQDTGRGAPIPSGLLLLCQPAHPAPPLESACYTPTNASLPLLKINILAAYEWDHNRLGGWGERGGMVDGRRREKVLGSRGILPIDSINDKPANQNTSLVHVHYQVEIVFCFEFHTLHHPSNHLCNTGHHLTYNLCAKLM